MTLSLWDRARVALRDRDAQAVEALKKEIDAAEPPLPAPKKNALLAQLLMAKGDEPGAKRALIGASKKRPLDPHEKLVLGMLLIEDAPKARKLFTAAGKGNLRDPRIPEGLGVTMVDMGEIDKGIKMLRRSIKDDDKSWRAQFALGMAFVVKGDASKAHEQFEIVVRMRPDYEPAWLGFAAQSIAIGKAAEASRVLGPVVGKAPGRDKLLLAYVDLLLHAGDSMRALAALTPLANDSRDPGLLLDYTELCLQCGYLDQATIILEKIEKIDAEQSRLWLLRGQIGELSEPRDVPASLAAYERALKVDKHYGRAMNALGLLLMRKTEHTDFARAGKLLSVAAKKKDSWGAVALANFALLRLTEDKSDEARRLAESVLKRKVVPAAARAQAEKIISGSAR